MSILLTLRWRSEILYNLESYVKKVKKNLLKVGELESRTGSYDGVQNFK